MKNEVALRNEIVIQSNGVEGEIIFNNMPEITI